MKFIILTTSKTFDIEKRCQIVGGVQTYTRDLCLLAAEKGYNTAIYQFADDQSDADDCFDGIEFHIRHKDRKDNQPLFDSIYAEQNGPDTLFVVATDQMDIKTKASNVIVIQHGIAFDNPVEGGFWSKTRFLQHLNKLLRGSKNVRRLYWSRNTVGVDYNYFNWVRTLGMIYPEKRYRVIPNYSSGKISKEELLEKLDKQATEKKKCIVFARRFCSYRGTIIFANCVERLLPLYPEAEFTFAGGGELKEEIERRFVNNPRVHITSFEAPESIEFHKRYDVAVVPTIYSEGTSLSLLEAMSAGCFPIATHVGGMTNILLDSYNGLLCYPNEEGVYNALVKALDMDGKEFRKVVENAYDSATEAFSLQQWKGKWSEFIDSVMNSYQK